MIALWNAALLSGQAPDRLIWVGNVDAETFANLVSDLLLLLAEPDRQGVLALADHLACIAHKSLEICERCRLRQQNSPATPENSTAF